MGIAISKMGFHAIKLPQLPSVRYWCTTLFLICSLLSTSQAKSCKCPSSGSGPDQDPKNMYTWNTTFDQLDGYLFVNSSSTFLPDGLGFYQKHLPSKLNLSEPGLFIIDEWIQLWKTSDDETTLHEASFNVVFNMSIYDQPTNQDTPVNSSMIFAIIPDYFRYINESLDTKLNCSWNPTSEPNLADNQFSIWVGEFDHMIFNETVVTSTCVQIDIIEPSSSIMKNYQFSIYYNSLSHNMEVQVKSENGQQITGNKPDISFSNISQFGLFSFYSSMGQLFQLHTWNSTVERLSAELKHKNKEATAIILSSVLGSAAVTVATAAAVYFYVNSKYRGWKKELDELAKSMQLLPGVPTQFSFSPRLEVDIEV